MELMELAKKLVSFKTSSFIAKEKEDEWKNQSNVEMAEFIKEEIEKIGGKTEIIEMPRKSTKEQKKANLISKFGEGDPIVMLSGHMDTVPPSEKWMKDDREKPYRLAEKNKKWFGLGIADMKLALAAMIKAAEKIRKATLKKSFLLVFTCDEEIGLVGARYLMREKKISPIPPYAVIGEPTEMIPRRMHKGYMKAVIKADGKSAHSSTPQSGLNAIERLMAVTALLLKYFQENISFATNQEFTTNPFPTINIGIIRGGSKVNVVPDKAELEFDLRLLPGFNSKRILSAIKDLVKQADPVDEKQRKKMELDQPYIEIDHVPSEPMYTPPQSEIVKVVESLIKKKAIDISYATEGAVFNKYRINSVILGPGNSADIHKDDEFVEQAQIDNLVGIYCNILTSLCCA